MKRHNIKLLGTHFTGSARESTNQGGDSNKSVEKEGAGANGEHPENSSRPEPLMRQTSYNGK